MNDDMSVYNEKVEQIINDMFQWIFPRPSAFEIEMMDIIKMFT